MELKEIIKKDLGLTQKKFAEEIGVFENTVNNWCIGKPISLENIKKIVGYYQKNNIPIDNFSKFIMNNYGLEVPVEIVEIGDKKEIDRLKKKSELYSRLYNEQLKLNNVFKKEIGLSELKQWSPSETARQILKSKNFEPIVKKLLKDYSEIEINKFQSKICEIIKKEILDTIVNIHNNALEKEKDRIIEELKSVKKAVRNFE
ncbi:MAG: helix-turn-helix transcriptional regulator [Clostridia bacterium]|nr:helix-turn-helix transcriptional regulator [Clostridia bacterium]